MTSAEGSATDGELDASMALIQASCPKSCN